MTKIKAIIFDMDGTLIDSEKAVMGAYQHVLERHGEVFDAAAIRTHIGRTLEDTYKTLVPNADPKKLAILHRDWQIERKHLLKAFVGVDEFLRTLKTYGLRLSAYTSARRIRTEVMLEVTGIRDHFEVILCGDEVVDPKPHQAGVVSIAKQMGVRSDQVIMVGDSEHDILSGKNAGVLTIGITHGFGTPEALEKAGADYIVNNLNELKNKIMEITQNNGS